MNIFWLDYDPVRCCEYTADSHVIKMPLEHCQLMSTALHECGIDPKSIRDPGARIYKPTHKNHPCAIWARTSLSNYNLLRELTIVLCEEYTYRYRRRHSCQDVVENLPDPILDDKGVTSLPLAMPPDCHLPDPVESYRKLYATHKRHLHSWRRRPVPEWLLSGSSVARRDYFFRISPPWK